MSDQYARPFHSMSSSPHSFELNLIGLFFFRLNPLSPCGPPRDTCHIRRAVLIRSAPDAQLAVAVGAPALDPAPGSDRARVVLPRRDGDGGDT
jgi:hypothetical protein